MPKRIGGLGFFGRNRRSQRAERSQQPNPSTPVAATRDIQKMDESFERSVLGGRNRPGKLLPLHQGAAEKGLTVSIHGINGNPQNMAPVTQGSIANDISTQTYAYDDNFRRLTKSSQDFANSLQQWIDANPGKPLRIDAHSMGTRVTLAAMGELASRGALEGREVQLNLIAPPLAGLKSANLAGTAPPFLNFIKNVRPGKDMGSNSKFQELLENVQLPDNVKTRVFLGGKDDIVNPDMEGFDAMLQGLNAEVHHFPEADHTSVIEDAARVLR